MKFDVHNVTVSPNEIREVIAALDAAIKRNQELKAICEQIIAVQSGAGGARAAVSGRGRRPKGVKTLRQVIVEVLKKSPKPLGAGALRDKALEAGYVTTATRQSFYTAVYNTATKAKEVKKTKDGFTLTAAAARKS